MKFRVTTAAAAVECEDGVAPPAADPADPDAVTNYDRRRREDGRPLWTGGALEVHRRAEV